MHKKWPDKFVIGITGNIGTGKSVVRRMLEHLGAYGIDADFLGHEAMKKGSIGYDQVVDSFGVGILTEQGEINRKKLGEIVFSSPEKLEYLERIIHPLVLTKIDELTQKSFSPVIVIEAIKLLEANIAENCDCIWVTWVSEEEQINRLIHSRGLSYQEAQQRISVQSPQKDKLRKADFIIRTSETFEHTWNQVTAGWETMVPPEILAQIKQNSELSEDPSGFTVIRATPSQSEWIAQFLQAFEPEDKQVTSSQITTLLSEKVILILIKQGSISGMLEWKVDRRISETTRVVLDPRMQVETILPILIKRMEKISLDYGCKLALVVPGKQLFPLTKLWADLGYRIIQPEELKVLFPDNMTVNVARPDDGLFSKYLRY